MHIKKCNKKMDSPCLFMLQQVFKMGYFYWLRVKNSKYLHAEFSLRYLGKAEFYLESKASFIVSCKLFLIAWLREYCTFSDSSVVSLKSSPWSKYTELGTIFQKNRVPLSNFFSSSNMFFIRRFLANSRRQNCGCAWREKENLFRCRENFGEKKKKTFVLYMHTLMCAR